MCGLDGIYNEHLIYASESLIYALSCLFDAMYRTAYVPIELKRGFSITMLKGSNKRKDDPKSYRAITLSSVILKLYQNLLLKRIKSRIEFSISPLQGGFQKRMGCIMTSYLVKECELFCKENKSKLFACFLDTMTAFDKVWHDGLFYKLHKLGISGRLWHSVVAMHTDMFSCVMMNGYKSDWFPVLLGTAQGGAWSPFLYLIYINDLIVKLTEIAGGLSIGNICSCAPTVADDMLLLSISITGLQSMIDTCYDYSRKWRFQFNSSKCGIIVFNESKNAAVKARRKFNLGSHTIQEVLEYTHLGVLMTPSYLKHTRAKTYSTRIRKTYFSLLNCAFHDNGLSPATCKNIYCHIVLP